MGRHKSYTPKQTKHVEYLTSIGIVDSDIAEETDVPYNAVQQITTKYWKQKMKTK